MQPKIKIKFSGWWNALSLSQRNAHTEIKDKDPNDVKINECLFYFKLVFICFNFMGSD